MTESADVPGKNKLLLSLTFFLYAVYMFPLDKCSKRLMLSQCIAFTDRAMESFFLIKVTRISQLGWCNPNFANPDHVASVCDGD